HHVPGEVPVDPIAEVEKDAAAARGQHVRDQTPLVVEDAVGWRRIHVGDDVAALEQREDSAHRRDILADVDHHRQMEGGDRLLRAPQGLEVIGIGDVFRHADLDADDDIAMACDGATRQVNVREGEVVQFAARADAAARDVDQEAADLRRFPRDGGNLIDDVCSSRAGIDPAGHAVLQGQRRPLFAAAGMRMDVDQAWRDDLPAGIDRVGSTRRNGGFYYHDPAAVERYVVDRVEPNRGIDDT